jgi:hypothetical protein
MRSVTLCGLFWQQARRAQASVAAKMPRPLRTDERILKGWLAPSVSNAVMTKQKPSGLGRGGLWGLQREG